jgi:hypothetical protein
VGTAQTALAALEQKSCRHSQGQHRLPEQTCPGAAQAAAEQIHQGAAQAAVEKSRPGIAQAAAERNRHEKRSTV